MAAEKLRDLSQPMDVALLDATVAAFYGTGSKEEVWSIFLSLLVCVLHCLLTFGYRRHYTELDFVWLYN